VFPICKLTPNFRPASDDGVELFVPYSLASQCFSPNIEIISTTIETLQKLASNPGGIHYACTKSCATVESPAAQINIPLPRIFFPHPHVLGVGQIYAYFLVTG
jgi:hypothetical protein